MRNPPDRSVVTGLRLAALWAGAATLALAAETAPAPLPGLPPEPRPLQIQATAITPRRLESVSADEERALAGDIVALQHAMERVRAALGATGAPASAPPAAARRAPAAAEGRHLPDGPRRASAKFGPERLSVQRFRDGYAEITIAIEREAAGAVYRELADLLGRPLDDTQVTAARQPVSLHLVDAAWDETLDHLLGQVGLGWHVAGTDPGQPLVLFDLARQPPTGEELEHQAQRSLLVAARDRQTPAAAEAMYLLAHHEAAAGRPLDAMRLYGNLAEAFGASQDPALRPWVQRAIRGIGDAMMAVRQYQDARGVYQSYLGRAAANDPDLPAVYLAAAEAGRQFGLARQDVVAFDEAIDLLHTMLDRFAKVPAAAAEVQLAHLTLGELLFDASRYEEAEAQLKHLAAKKVGGVAADQLAFWLAECAFQQGRVDEARPGYERLGRARAAGRPEANAAAGFYATAAYRVGQCHLRRAEPQYVLALFAFLKARQDFPRSPLDAELLIGIARCYAELERDDDTVNALWELLKQDGVADEPQRRQRVDRLLGDLEGQLADYTAPVRAKILFYIAQADFRRAQRDQAGRAAAAAAAVSHYERVLAEQPPLDLAHAAKLALARAAQLGGQDARAAQALKELLREPSLSARDREAAALQLGTWYHAQGKPREAIRAFRGEVPEP